MGACIRKPVVPRHTETPVEVFRVEPVPISYTTPTPPSKPLNDARAKDKAHQPASNSNIASPPSDLRKSRDKSLFSKNKEPPSKGQQDKAVQAGSQQVRQPEQQGLRCSHRNPPHAFLRRVHK